MNMSMFTIQGRLCASEETRRYFWEKTEKYTLLVNELLEKIPQQSQFQEWEKKGNISRKIVREILSPLKDNHSYAGLPARFYTSVELISCETYNSWLALQQKRLFKMLGKKRWLQAVESEFELLATTDFNPNAVLAKARDIQNEAMHRLNGQGSKQESLIGILLDMHDDTAENPLSRRAINHLLINHLKISEEEENLDKLSERLDKKRVEIRRLEEQLNSRLPKGRDPTGQRYLQILSYITSLPELSNDPQKLEAELDKLTIQQQLPLFNELPYPIRFESSDDLYWSVLSQDSPNSSHTEHGVHQELPKSEKLQTKHRPQPKERICVQFKGTQNFTFKIQCAHRQLPIFRQFLVDYQTYKKLPETERFSQGLFALRSACLIWRKDDRKHGSKKKRANDKQEDQLKPWNTHRLYLHCTVDRRLLTAEGTEQVCEEKKNRAIQALKGKQELEVSELQKLGLTKAQISDVERKRSTLNRLENNPYPPRPNTIPYEGQPHIVIGVSFSRNEPVTIVIVDVEKQEVLERQSAEELLNRGEPQYIWRNGKKEPLLRDGTERQHPNGGKLYIRKGKYAQCKPYRLVEQLHRQHQRNCKQRIQEQKQDRYRETNSDSSLGLYVDRLIASRIVSLALQRKAGTIAIPQLKGVRENVESDIRAKAERLFPNEKELQKKYAKDYRDSFHRWSYARISECIRECAKKEGIAVVLRKQPSQGNLEEKAKAIALSS
jgi:IS605 OrfB family transposase